MAKMNEYRTMYSAYIALGGSGFVVPSRSAPVSR